MSSGAPGPGPGPGPGRQRYEPSDRAGSAAQRDYGSLRFPAVSAPVTTLLLPTATRYCASVLGTSDAQELLCRALERICKTVQESSRARSGPALAPHRRRRRRRPPPPPWFAQISLALHSRSVLVLSGLPFTRIICLPWLRHPHPSTQAALAPSPSPIALNNRISQPQQPSSGPADHPASPKAAL